MIHIIDNKDISYLIGKSKILVKPTIPYSNLVVDFLDYFSREVLNNNQAKEYSDLITLAFWCRKRNISKIKSEYYNDINRLGLGLVFHITPSNIPINFMISFIYGLLSGNSNIIRVPSKNYNQIDIILRTLSSIFKNDKYRSIKNTNIFIKYSRNNNITQYLSMIANGRIIWGGDEVVNHIRTMPIPPKSIDIAFANRYSLALLNADELLLLDNKKLDKLVDDFYNDTFLMDQNACSSPYLILWIGEKVEEAKNIFWQKVLDVVKQRYELFDILTVDKYTKLCQLAIDFKSTLEIINDENIIYRIQLNILDNDIKNLKGSGGFFCEYSIEGLDDIIDILDTDYQTLTYFGFNKLVLKNFVLENNLLGIDRIVPFGRALDISVIWDGYDIVKTLSRKIDIL